MEALGRDALAHILHYPEPVDQKEALASPDAEEWAKEMKVVFDLIKRTDLLSDSVQLPDYGRVIGTKRLFKQKRNLDVTVERNRARLV